MTFLGNRLRRFWSRLRVAGGRHAPLLLVMSTAVALFNAGMVWMTHMHHDGLRHVSPESMAAYDVTYENLAAWVVVPMSVLSVACALAMIVLRDPRVPRWMLGTGIALQVSVWVARMTIWGRLADETRAAGWASRVDGALEPAYAQYMATHWIRITLITTYALLVLGMLVVATARSSAAGSSQVPSAQRVRASVAM